jgi:hypothetical protein
MNNISFDAYESIAEGEWKLNQLWVYNENKQTFESSDEPIGVISLSTAESKEM